MRHRRAGPYQVQAAIAATHARAGTPAETDWAEIDALYAALERMQPSPVVTLNRAVAVSKVARPGGGAGDDRTAGRPAVRLFPFLRRQGAFLLQLGRTDEARIAFDRAIALANTPAQATHIRQHLDRLTRENAR